MKIPAWAASGLFALALVAGGAVTARADVTTLDVSGRLFALFPSAACLPTCMLGGTLTIDNSPGASNNGFVSADVTATGFSPSVGPFTQFSSLGHGRSLGHGLGLTALTLADANAPTGFLELSFSPPTAGSLVGYAGGPLSTHTLVFTLARTLPEWDLTSGSLIPQTAVPEPSSLALLLSALASLCGLLGWRIALRPADADPSLTADGCGGLDPNRPEASDRRYRRSRVR